MAGRRPAYRKEEIRSGGGGGILFVVALVLAAGIIKYADAPFAQQARNKVSELIAGVPDVSQALSAIGGKGDDVQEVFGTQDKNGYASSAGNADDILGREKTLFPDTVDETVHTMKFEHALPTEGTLTSTFGSRLSPITGQPGFHYGLDIAADEGEKIGAFADGTVRETGESGYGNYVILDHADGFATLYAHCSSISAKVGDTVKCGDEIAKVGQTGNATGPHLHLELWKDGAALDPADYITGL